MAHHQLRGDLAAQTITSCSCAASALPLQLVAGLIVRKCDCLQDPIPHMGKFLNTYKR